MPCHACPTCRLVAMPPSPPKNAGSIKADAATISAMPSEIIANGVPARRVVTKPKTMPKNSPVNPPTNGTSVTGRLYLPAASAFSRCAQTKAAKP